jgi:uncharacterized phage protein gp47/JayE
MSLTTPTTADLTATIVAQLEAAINQSIPFLPKSFSRVLAKALAGITVLVYKYAGFIFLQLFVAYATNEETTVNGVIIRPLTEWGRLTGVGDLTPATRAELVIEVTVTEQTGTLAGGANLLRIETGVGYQTIDSVALSAATVQVTMRATSDQDGGDGSGSIGNLVAGDQVQFANPLPNVATIATVLSVVTNGADAEDVEVYRQRIIDHFQAPPQGGAYADYRTWGVEVPGIIRVYPYTGDPGEVDVYSEATVASSGSADGIPTSAQLTAVYDSIQLDVADLASRRPAGAAVNSLPITRRAFDVSITGLSVDDEAAVQVDIENAVDEHLRSKEPFIVGLSALPRDDRVTVGGVSGVVDGVVDSVGGSFTALTIESQAVPIVAYVLDDGEKAKAGTVTFP